MKNTPLRIIIRRFVLATAFPPFINIYRTFYALVILLATRMFRKFPEIKAVYLRRGSAKREIIPLLSDIDFAVITRGMDEETRTKLLSRYEVLVNTTTLADKTLEVFDEETFFNLWETSDFFQYRFMEGKSTWKLLYGFNYIEKLQELPVEKLYGGLFTELKIWWTIFEWRFFQNRKYSAESVTRNNTCYKAVSEILKMNLALNKDILEYSRRRVLERSRNLFEGDELNFIIKLEDISRKNYRSKEIDILDKTNSFLLNYLNRFFKESADHPYLKPLDKKSQKVLYSADEMLLSEADKEHIDKLVDFIKVKLEYTYRGSYLLSGIYFNLDELLLMINIDPENIPSVKDLSELNAFHKNAKDNVRSRIKLFILLPDSAFQINTDDFKMSWQSILNPNFNPDLFELLARTEFRIDGENYNAKKQFTVWSKPVQHFLCEEKRLFFELINNPSIFKLNNLDFLRIFWKTLQLVTVTRSSEREEIVYPLSLYEIEKALYNEGIPLPGDLKVLKDAYRSEINGRSEDISLLFPAAVNYLKESE